MKRPTIIAGGADRTVVRWLMETDDEVVNRLFKKVVTATTSMEGVKLGGGEGEVSGMRESEEGGRSRVLELSRLLGEESRTQLWLDESGFERSYRQEDISRRPPIIDQSYASIEGNFNSRSQLHHLTELEGLSDASNSLDSEYFVPSDKAQMEFKEELGEVMERLRTGVSYTFATGTSKEGSSENNTIELWSLLVKEQTPTIFQPRRLYSLPHEGEVNDLDFLGKSRIVSGSSTGKVNLYQLMAPITDLTLEPWEFPKPRLVHKYEAHDPSQGGCSRAKFGPSFQPVNLESSLILNQSSFDNLETSVLSTGYDGSLAVRNIEQDCFTTAKHQLASRIYDVIWFSPSLATVACSGGTLKLVDLRVSDLAVFKVDAKQSSLPSMKTCPTGDFLSLAQHPHQSMTFATGTSKGGMAVMDLRHSGPTSVLSYLPNLHSTPIYDLQFLPHRPDYCLTAAADGSLTSVYWKPDKWSDLALRPTPTTTSLYDHPRYRDVIHPFTTPSVDVTFLLPHHSIRFHPLSQLLLTAHNQLHLTHLPF